MVCSSLSLPHPDLYICWKTWCNGNEVMDWAGDLDRRALNWLAHDPQKSLSHPFEMPWLAPCSTYNGKDTVLTSPFQPEGSSTLLCSLESVLPKRSCDLGLRSSLGWLFITKGVASVSLQTYKFQVCTHPDFTNEFRLKWELAAVSPVLSVLASCSFLPLSFLGQLETRDRQGTAWLALGPTVLWSHLLNQYCKPCGASNQ